jgi:hypothetical protein
MLADPCSLLRNHDGRECAGDATFWANNAGGHYAVERDVHIDALQELIDPRTGGYNHGMCVILLSIAGFNCRNMTIGMDELSCLLPIDMCGTMAEYFVGQSLYRWCGMNLDAARVIDGAIDFGCSHAAVADIVDVVRR